MQHPFLTKITRFIILLIQSGTGSHPQGVKGWHLLSLFKVSHPPFQGPCLDIATYPYSLHVGMNLHFGPINGETIFL